MGIVARKHPSHSSEHVFFQDRKHSTGRGSLEQRFDHIMRSLLPSEGKLVVAVSGGMDSIALLHLVRGCCWIHPDRVVVAHFDHALRLESLEEAGFVAGLCQTLGVRLIQERWSDPHGQGNVQGRAREARYRFFIKVARQSDSGMIATGHHGDDQVETFWEHLLRGSGVKGLGAMSVIRPLQPGLMLVRPMLFFFRDEIHSWVLGRGLEWREDPSNRSEKYLRSRLRHEWIPLTNAFAPQLRQRVLETAVCMNRADGALTWMLEHVWPSLDVQTISRGLSLLRPSLVVLPDELVVRTLSRCSEVLTGTPYAQGFRAVDGFLHMVRSSVRCWRMRVRGLEISRQGDRILLCIADVAPRGEKR